MSLGGGVAGVEGGTFVRGLVVMVITPGNPSWLCRSHV